MILEESNIIFEEIARREYEIAGTTDKVIVVLGRPQKYPSGRDYYCPFKVIGKGWGYIHWIIGMDEVQAIQYALRMINVELTTSKRTEKLKLLWSQESDLGFQEWDLMILNTLEARLKFDHTLKGEDRNKLNRRVKFLKLQLKKYFKDQYSPQRITMREKIKEIQKNPELLKRLREERNKKKSGEERTN